MKLYPIEWAKSPVTKSTGGPSDPVHGEEFSRNEALPIAELLKPTPANYVDKLGKKNYDTHGEGRQKTGSQPTRTRYKYLPLRCKATLMFAWWEITWCTTLRNCSPTFVTSSLTEFRKRPSSMKTRRTKLMNLDQLETRFHFQPIKSPGMWITVLLVGRGTTLSLHPLSFSCVELSCNNM